MSSILQNVWQRVSGQPERAAEVAPRPRTAPARLHLTKTLNLDIAPTDPLVLYFQNQPNAVELQRLDLDSPALRALKAAGVRLAVPLVSHGELIGLLNLGPRLSEQDYSADDRGLLISVC